MATPSRHTSKRRHIRRLKYDLIDPFACFDDAQTERPRHGGEYYAPNTRASRDVPLFERHDREALATHDLLVRMDTDHESGSSKLGLSKGERERYKDRVRRRYDTSEIEYLSDGIGVSVVEAIEAAIEPNTRPRSNAHAGYRTRSGSQWETRFCVCTGCTGKIGISHDFEEHTASRSHGEAGSLVGWLVV